MDPAQAACTILVLRDMHIVEKVLDVCAWGECLHWLRFWEVRDDVVEVFKEILIHIGGLPIQTDSVVVGVLWDRVC